MKNCRVQFDISCFFNDYRRNCYLRIDKNKFKTVEDVLQYVKSSFKINEPIYLQESGIWLPNFEDVTVILSAAEPIKVARINEDRDINDRLITSDELNSGCQNNIKSEAEKKLMIIRKRKSPKDEEELQGKNCAASESTVVGPDISSCGASIDYCPKKKKRKKGRIIENGSASETLKNNSDNEHVVSTMNLVHSAVVCTNGISNRLQEIETNELQQISASRLSTDAVCGSLHSAPLSSLSVLQEAGSEPISIGNMLDEKSPKIIKKEKSDEILQFSTSVQKRKRKRHRKRKGKDDGDELNKLREAILKQVDTSLESYNDRLHVNRYSHNNNTNHLRFDIDNECVSAEEDSSKSLKKEDRSSKPLYRKESSHEIEKQETPTKQRKLESEIRKDVDHLFEDTKKADISCDTQPNWVTPESAEYNCLQKLKSFHSTPPVFQRMPKMKQLRSETVFVNSAEKGKMEEKKKVNPSFCHAEDSDALPIRSATASSPNGLSEEKYKRNSYINSISDLKPDDVIQFQVLYLSSEYLPTMSDVIIGRILSIKDKLSIKVLSDTNVCLPLRGKFSLPEEGVDEPEKVEQPNDILELEYKDLLKLSHHQSSFQEDKV